MAEMDVYHEQKIEDIKMIVGDYLDGEIILYEQVCVFFKINNLLLCLYNNLPNQQLIDSNPSQSCKQQPCRLLFLFLCYRQLIQLIIINPNPPLNS
jgi:hypothetical protein